MAQSQQERRQAQKRVAKSLKSGKSPLSGIMPRRKATQTRNGPKASERDHLQSSEFSGGKHHAPSSAGAKKNAYGSMSSPPAGKHSLNKSLPKHGGGSSPSYGKGRERDVAGAYKASVGAGYVGKHRKPGA